jgi:MoxR-like ATPase
MAFMSELMQVSPAGDASAAAAARISSAVAGFVRGKASVIELSLTCLLAEGHLLLDDVPGVGKTSLARALSQAMGVGWHRIQFTPDVLPSDITGVSVYNQGSGAFEFHPGPVFASVILADEINRATPRTQSALLEAMEERTVSVDGVTRPLPSPFMVIATQNPVDMAGTYPLPEAQLDRFLMRTSIGYPDHDAEVTVVTDHHHGARVSEIAPVASPEEVLSLIAAAASVQVTPEVVDYIVRLVTYTRSAPGVALGASPRGSVGLLRAVRARALVQGRGFATPGDVQALAEPVLAHRILLDVDGQARGLTGASVIADAVAATPAPQPH